jgi:REP element-mobilizing transposase RayT
MYLFITSTTYAQWLPGDKRGFVNRNNNQYDTPFYEGHAGLRHSAKNRLKGEPIFLNDEHAQVLFEQFQETVSRRSWKLFGAAIMPNHVHILLEVNDDSQPEKAAGDLKSFGSRRLSEVFGKPKSGTWWTTGCSIHRKTADSIPHVIRYIKDQDNALLIWIAPEYDVE